MPFVEVEALGEEQELALPLLEQVAGARHLRLGGVLARAGEVHVGLLHVVAEADVVEVRRDVDQGVGHDRVLVLRQHFLDEELEADGWERGTQAESEPSDGRFGLFVGDHVECVLLMTVNNRETEKDDQKIIS